RSVSGSTSTLWPRPLILTVYAVMGPPCFHLRLQRCAPLARLSSSSGSHTSGQLNDCCADHGELAILVSRPLLDVDETGAGLGALADGFGAEVERVALWVVAANLGRRAPKPTVVPHPVGKVVGEPRAALGSIVVSAGRADDAGEVFLPVHPLGTIRYSEPV